MSSAAPTKKKLKVDTTDLEIRVRNVEEIEPNERLILYTQDPVTEETSETKFSVPWKSTLLSQMMNRFRETLPDGDDLERVIPIVVPDCEAEHLMMIAMYLEFYSENPQAVGVSGSSNKDVASPEMKPSAAVVDEQEEEEDESNISRRVAPVGKKMNAPAAAAASSSPTATASPTTTMTGVGAHLLERPYKPNQMEVDLTSVVDSEACLIGYEEILAKQICAMSNKDAIRTLRCLLSAGWFLQMNQSFLDLVGWLLSLRYRGHNVHEIKEMMSPENVKVRQDRV